MSSVEEEFFFFSILSVDFCSQYEWNIERELILLYQFSTTHLFTAEAQQPPAVSLPANQYVRIVGEMLHVPCHIENQDHSYQITWSSSEKVKLCVLRIWYNRKHESHEIIGEKLN